MSDTHTAAVDAICERLGDFVQPIAKPTSSGHPWNKPLDKDFLEASTSITVAGALARIVILPTITGLTLDEASKIIAAGIHNLNEELWRSVNQHPREIALRHFYDAVVNGKLET
jgi:hypothetical protein